MKITAQEVKGWLDERTGIWNWTLGMTVDPEGVDILTPDQVERANSTYEQMQEVIKGRITASTPKAEPAVPECMKEKVQEAVRDKGAYDPVKKIWNHCPRCGSINIDHLSAAGKTYQSCMRDRIFLQPDGTEKAMKPIGGK